MLGIGIVGFGEHAQKVHVQVLQNLRGINLVGIADPDPVRQEQARRRIPAAKIFSDYDQLLDLPSLDALIICPPTALHAPIAIAAMRKGKHIYLEKPLGLTLQQALPVIQLWRNRGLVGMIGFNYRFHPLFQSARQLIQSGALGDVIHVRTIFSTRSKKIAAWRESPASGGGVLLDLGSHHFDLIRFLFNQEIVSVFARTRSITSEADQTEMEMQLESGAVVQSVFSFRMIEEDCLEIYSNTGKWMADRILSHQLEFSSPSRHQARWHRAAHAVRAFGRSLCTQVAARGPGLDPSYRVALTRFIAAVGEETGVQPDLQDGFESLRVAQAAMLSAQKGSVVLTHSVEVGVSH